MYILPKHIEVIELAWQLILKGVDLGGNQVKRTSNNWELMKKEVTK